MTEQQEGDFVQVRQQISDLGSAILELRETADRLLERAAGRTSLAVLEPVRSAPALDSGQHADSSEPPVWPRLATYEPQHGQPDPPASAVSPADDGSFGAPAAEAVPSVIVEATVLEFVPREPAAEPESRPPTDVDDAPAGAVSSMPADWNTPSDDDAAIEKFFSAEVEPEPAQRWLLSD